MTFSPLAMMKISKHAFASDKSILKVCLYVCVCVCSVHVTNCVGASAGVRAALAQQRGGRAFLMAPEPSLDSALVL